ncbi:hypothetical protein B0A48_06049 [Cryoendolithus antarcticus]|uniref:Myotubularin phosphatase domain-containing protein n=1 Tax=Cryoendolithus antarcticus TaxID=1507870 RepID=A0A1V8TD33_9PEZI|nr:hypothetical protein B0A48_06049 [Cryoendolithus antarcticus]
MAEAGRDMRVKNVSLHRRGQQENGTLHLTQHHLIFSYLPASTNGSSTVNEAAADRPQKRTRPKEIFVPYPLVHHCTLRPSHVQSNALQSSKSEIDLTSGEDEVDEGLFPPTYGTSSSTRPSTDSARLSIYADSPRRTESPAPRTSLSVTSGSGRTPALRIRCKDFRIFAIHFHQPVGGQTPDQLARDAFYALRTRCCVESVDKMHAFDFKPPAEEKKSGHHAYIARKEFARMGISPKAADGPGAAWRVSEINHDYAYSATYPSVLCVPSSISDNTLKYGGAFRSKSRIPALSYLHFNGGSITRASQPLVGIKGNRNRQDEKLVSAIFSSHTPYSATPEESPDRTPPLQNGSSATLPLECSDGHALDSDLEKLSVGGKAPAGVNESSDKQSTPPQKKLYGSTRENLIVDARPYVNMTFNKVTGGGIEDVAHYIGHDMPTEIVFLRIENIHSMRKSLEKVVDSLGNADYVDLPPNQELLRKSGWLRHIAGVLEGAEKVARTVGLGGSHALIHCSDGWDRTSQVSAVAQVMLDPHYRTIEGFITLIQKDFLSFGHKFRDRNGIEGCEDWFEIENERIQPSKRHVSNAESNNLSTISSKALSGAKSWFEKGRGNLFKQQNASRDNVLEASSSRPASPPPNEFLHSPPSKSEKKPHKMEENEVSPIFHQFLDAVYQLMHQRQSEFEYNERFLRRLFYHVYAGQYGNFLFNTERERSQYEDRLPSAWGHFLARKEEFTNTDYKSGGKDTLILPKRSEAGSVPDVRWWSALFGRTDEEMNVPKALAIDPPKLEVQPSAVSYDEGMGKAGTGLTVENMRATKSTPNLTATVAEHSEGTATTENGKVPLASAIETASRPPLLSKETDFEILEKYTGASEASSSLPTHSSEPVLIEPEDASDPLGVSTAPRQMETRRTDFAAFARNAAFSER